MTVKELKEALENLNDNMPVAIEVEYVNKPYKLYCHDIEVSIHGDIGNTKLVLNIEE